MNDSGQSVNASQAVGSADASVLTTIESQFTMEVTFFFKARSASTPPSERMGSPPTP